MNWRTFFYIFFKRAFDIVFALFLLIAFSPIYIITALIIVITSPGSPIYRAKRVGVNGKVFTCYKFRSMHINSGKVHLTTLRNDSRIFPFGKFIRKVKIDEMPQAVNILLGHMSVVGPRPEDKEIADEIYSKEYSPIMSVKPGLTSPGSLYDFTHGETFESEEEYRKVFLKRKLALELYYVEHRSAFYDLKLIFRTAKLIFLMLLGKRRFDIPKELKHTENTFVEAELQKQ